MLGLITPSGTCIRLPRRLPPVIRKLAAADAVLDSSQKAAQFDGTDNRFRLGNFRRRDGGFNGLPAGIACITHYGNFLQCFGKKMG
jgi:hypothetical protein